MRARRQTCDQETLIRQCDEWLTAHWHRLQACVRKNADADLDLDMLLADTARKVARVFCTRPMSEELLIRYTLRSLRHAALKARQANRVRRRAEEQYRQNEQLRRNSVGQDVQRELRELVRRLPEPHGSILTQRLWERQSHADIAARMGMSESSVRRYYETAIELMRNRMNRN